MYIKKNTIEEFQRNLQISKAKILAEKALPCGEVSLVSRKQTNTYIEITNKTSNYNINESPPCDIQGI